MNNRFVVPFCLALLVAFFAAAWWQFGAFITREDCHKRGGTLIRTEDSYGQWFCAQVSRLSDSQLDPNVPRFPVQRDQPVQVDPAGFRIVRVSAD